MKNKICILFLLISTVFYAQTHKIIGKWKSVDDETSKALSIIEIYEKGGEIYGKVHEILEEKDKKKICVYCDGEDKNKPIQGLIVIKGLNKKGNEYKGGKILDPKSGNLYNCTIMLDEKDKLKVRGFIGISLFGRTQYWYRVK
jgi:uncharacterized protein (DUF2147 family)